MIIQSFQANNVNFLTITSNSINKKLNPYGQAVSYNPTATLAPLALMGFFQKILSLVAQVAVAAQAVYPCKGKHFVFYWKANV